MLVLSIESFIGGFVLLGVNAAAIDQLADCYASYTCEMTTLLIFVSSALFAILFGIGPVGSVSTGLDAILLLCGILAIVFNAAIFLVVLTSLKVVRPSATTETAAWTPPSLVAWSSFINCTALDNLMKWLREYIRGTWNSLQPTCCEIKFVIGNGVDTDPPPDEHEEQNAYPVFFFRRLMVLKWNYTCFRHPTRLIASLSQIPSLCRDEFSSYRICHLLVTTTFLVEAACKLKPAQAKPPLSTVTMATPISLWVIKKLPHNQERLVY